MRRAVLILGVLAATTAHAAPKPWTLPMEGAWQDITEEALKDPGIAGMAKQIRDMGGRFEANAYTTDTTSLFIATVDVADMPQDLAELAAFEGAARTRATQAGIEQLYREEKTGLTLGATHTVKGSEMIHTRRITGFPEGQGMRSVSFNCYGDTPTCDKLLASASVDVSTFLALDKLPEHPREGRLKLLFMIACSVAALFVIAAFVIMKRRRQRATDALG